MGKLTRTIVLEDVREAALRPSKPSSWKFWALAGGLGLLVLWGVVSYVYQLLYGLGVAGYSDRSFWGIYEANLVAFIALSYGGALVSAILRLTQAHWRAPITRLAESMAVFSLLVGMTFAVVHLGRPERIWELIATPQVASPIFWDFVVISTYLMATLVFLYLPLVPDLAIVRDRIPAPTFWQRLLYGGLSLNWRNNPAQRSILNRAITTVAILIIPLAVFVHSVLSWAFALTGRPGWDSTIFAPDFVVAALYSGVAMVLLVIAGFRHAYRLDAYTTLKHFRYLAFILLTLNVLYLYFTFTELLTEGYVMNDEVVPVLLALLVGSYAPAFWLFVLGAGLAPLLLIAIPATRTITGIVVASSLVVAGMWLKRILIVVPVVAHPLITGVWGTFAPTGIAMGITIGAAAAIPLLLMLFFKLVPVLSIDEMEEVAAEEASPVPSTVGRAVGQALADGGALQ